MITLNVWDGPVRLFHWALVGSVALAFYTVKTDAAPFHFPIEVHARAGYVLVGLLLFRWLWGLVGTPHARFADFLYPSATLLDYLRRLLRGRPPVYTGHNPLGGLMVLLMLLSLSLQALSGLFLSDDIFFEAPLHGLVERDTARTLARLHHLNANLLLGLIAAHLLALLVHRLQGERLVGAMITGRKPSAGEPDGRSGLSGHAYRWRALGVGLLVLLPVLWLWRA